jgi:hypothetical protein
VKWRRGGSDGRRSSDGSDGSMANLVARPWLLGPRRAIDDGLAPALADDAANRLPEWGPLPQSAWSRLVRSPNTRRGIGAFFCTPPPQRLVCLFSSLSLFLSPSPANSLVPARRPLSRSPPAALEIPHRPPLVAAKAPVTTAPAPALNLLHLLQIVSARPAPHVCNNIPPPGRPCAV